MAFRSTVPQERPEYDLSNDLHEEVAADVVTESGAAGTTVSVVASLSIAANTEPSFRGAIRGMSGYGMRLPPPQRLLMRASDLVDHAVPSVKSEIR